MTIPAVPAPGSSGATGATGAAAPSWRLRLRMTRRDIASCLGVAHETVSRALTGLAQGGCIAVSHRDIEIVDAEGLHRMQRVTRGATRGASAPEPRMFVA